MRACHGKLEQGKLVLEQKPLNYELLCCSAFIKMLMHTKSGAAEISSSSATPNGSCYRGLLKPQGHHEFEVKMGQEVDVFDYTVYIDPFGKLQYRPNLKLEHKSYVPLESNHPLHIYRGVAYGEAWRLLKRSSSRAAYDSAMLELHKKLAQAHFPDDAIAVARRLSFDKHRKSAVEQMIRTHGKRYQTGVRSKTVDRLLIPLLYDRSVDLEPILRDVIQSSIDLLPKADREYVRSHMIGFKLQPKAMNRLGIKDT